MTKTISRKNAMKPRIKISEGIPLAAETRVSQSFILFLESIQKKTE
jgi:hypothetical protein